jgi:phosphoglucosamine mutase
MLNGIFGTDGVRGRANSYPMTPELAMKLAQSAAAHFARNGEAARVLIGKDTRL